MTAPVHPDVARRALSEGERSAARAAFLGNRKGYLYREEDLGLLDLGELACERLCSRARG